MRAALSDGQYASAMGPDYIYVWDENPAFAIWDGENVLGGDDFSAALTPAE